MNLNHHFKSIKIYLSIQFLIVISFYIVSLNYSLSNTTYSFFKVLVTTMSFYGLFQIIRYGVEYFKNKPGNILFKYEVSKKIKKYLHKYIVVINKSDFERVLQYAYQKRIVIIDINKVKYTQKKFSQPLDKEEEIALKKMLSKGICPISESLIFLKDMYSKGYYRSEECIIQSYY